MVLLAAILAVGGLALLTLLHKFIRTSPPGTTPVIKVSGLDLLQVISLRRSAEKREQDGDAHGALLAWQTALGNNLANPETWRGMLAFLARHDQLPQSSVDRLLVRVPWFLQITDHASGDVLLAARACNRHGLPDLAFAVLDPQSSALEPTLRREYLKALLALGQVYEFAAGASDIPPANDDDADWTLYQAAYRAGWGPKDQQDLALHRLDEARQSPQAALAARLSLQLGAKNGDVERCEAGLETLRDVGQDRFGDHARLWRALVANQQAAEARRRLAARGDRTPQFPLDARLLIECLLATASESTCLEFLAPGVERFGVTRSPSSVSLWTAYATLLMARNDWQQLRAVAARALDLAPDSDALAGYAHFLEGYAAHRLSQGLLARTRFEMAAATGFPVGDAGLQAALGMQHSECPDLALTVLSGLRARLAQHPAYWETTLEIVMDQRRDEALLLEAARRGLELQPDSPVAKLNYAAALLIRREEAPEALRHTFDVVSQRPQLLVGLINHAIALAHCERPNESERILRAIAPESLDDIQRASYAVALVEVHSRTGEWDQVGRDLAGVRRDLLFPTQLEWVRSVERRLAEHTGSEAQ